MSFRPNPFHANYFMNIYNMSSMYLNKILFKPTTCMKVFPEGIEGISIEVNIHAALGRSVINYCGVCFAGFNRIPTLLSVCATKLTRPQKRAGNCHKHYRLLKILYGQ